MSPRELWEALLRIHPSVLGLWAARLIGAAVITAVLVWGLRRLGRVQARVDAFMRRTLHRRGKKGLVARSADVLYRAARTVLGLSRIVVSIALVYAWLASVTILLDPTHRLFDLVVSPLVGAAETVGVAAVEFIPNLAMLVVIVAVARFATRMVHALAEAIHAGEIVLPWLDRDVTEPTRRIVTIIVWLIALIMGFPYLPGSHSRAFQGIGIVLGVLVSLGSGSAAGNLLAGLVLMYSRAFRPGDRVKIGDTVGDVVALGAFSTRVRTTKDEEVVIPNSIIQQSPITNYSRYAREAGVQVSARITVGYATPWRRVHELLIEAGLATDGVEKEPPPYVLQTALGDFHVAYDVFAFTKRSNELHLIEARLRESALDVFARERIELVAPHYTSLRDGSPLAVPAVSRG